MDLTGKLLALASAILWARAVIFFKQAGESARPFALNFYKTTVTFFLLVPLLLVTGVPLTAGALPLRFWLAAGASGVLGVALSDTLFFVCLNLIGAGLTAIIDCLYSPLVMLASWLVLAERPRPEQLAGAGLVIVAILVAALQRHGHLPLSRLGWGVLIGASAMGLMAASIVLMRPVLNRAPVLWVTAVRQLAAMTAMAPFALLGRSGRQRLQPLLSGSARRYALPGTLLGNLLAMTCWVAAFKFTSVNSAAVLNQTNTVLIVILATVLLGETFTPRKLLAVVLAIGGSLLVLLG